jgi:hypothetical protein
VSVHVHQADLDFRLTCFDRCRVGNLLLMLTLVFTFSSGMPVLYVLGLLAAAVQTVLDRWLLTKQCQMPKLNDSQLPSLLLGKPKHVVQYAYKEQPGCNEQQPHLNWSTAASSLMVCKTQDMSTVALPPKHQSSHGPVPQWLASYDTMLHVVCRHPPLGCSTPLCCWCVDAHLLRWRQLWRPGHLCCQAGGCHHKHVFEHNSPGPHLAVHAQQITIHGPTTSQTHAARPPTLCANGQPHHGAKACPLDELTCPSLAFCLLHCCSWGWDSSTGLTYGVEPRS